MKPTIVSITPNEFVEGKMFDLLKALSSLEEKHGRENLEKAILRFYPWLIIDAEQKEACEAVKETENKLDNK